MAEPPKRDSWRDLTDEQKEQVATEKGKTHKFPELFQGNSEDEWLCWFDDIEAAFVAKKITMDEAKIFCAIRSMGYTLRKEVETLESSKGRSWEEFRKEIEKEWTIDAKYGSQEALKRVIEEFATMSLQVSESRFNAYVRRFKMEAKKLQEPPALLSNKTLVDMFLKVFDYMVVKAILDGLQIRNQMRAQAGRVNAEDQERRKQDPFTLEEVIAQAELIIKSGSGYTYMHGSSEAKSKKEPSEVPIPREVRQGILKLPGKVEPQREAKLDEATMSALARVDGYDTKLKSLQSDVEQFQMKVVEGFKKSEKALDENMIELRKLIMNSTSVNREMPREPPQKSAYSSGYRPPQMKTGTAILGKAAADMSSGGNTCFMCGKPGHITTECDYQEECIKRGWLRKEASGKWVLYDGSPVPFVKFGDNTKQRWEIIKERAEAGKWPNTGGEDPTASMFVVEHEPLVNSFLQFNIADHPVVKELIDKEDELSNDPEVVNPVEGRTGRDKDATPVITPPSTAKRPFDDVPAVDRPAIPRDHVVAVSDVAGKVRQVFPNTDALKLSKGPHRPQGRGTSEVVDKPIMKSTEVEEDIVDRMMKQELSVTQEELFAVSPGIKKIFQRKARNRAVRRTSVESFLNEHSAEHVGILENVIGNEESYIVQVADMNLDEQFEVLKVAVGDLPVGAVVQKDITEVFRQDIESNDCSKIIIVASTSDALRSVYPKVNHSEEVESILDSGSQIIAMDMMVAASLGISWDPDTVIHMQGANGQLKKTRGLARNVPFRFGDLTFFLQLHILDGAPYKVLLGRPFDVLSESSINNYADGYQELTIKCPNSGQRSTIGTYPRGQGKKTVPRKTEHTLKDMGRPTSEERQTMEETDSGKGQSQANHYSSEEAGNFRDTLMN
ncbi:hypothetical protein PQX77_019585 [Marasmius sp. AFHP31]|nr:hypothetical protein PQX77_019585 [Marasmius sp. AFHP31]